MDVTCPEFCRITLQIGREAGREAGRKGGWPEGKGRLAGREAGEKGGWREGRLAVREAGGKRGCLILWLDTWDH